MHKSQGEGRPRRRGPSYEYFATTGGEAPRNDLMDGIITDWRRLNGGEPIQQMVEKIIKAFNPEHPENSVDDLVELYKRIQSLPLSGHGVWWKKKMNEVQDLILECSGILAEATSNDEYAIPGEKMNINFWVNQRNQTGMQLESIALNSAESHSFDSSFNIPLPVNQNISFNQTFTVSNSKPLTQPYWLAKPMDGPGMFTVEDQTLIGNAENEAAYTARFLFKYKDISFIVKSPVLYKYTDPVKGEVYEPFVVITPLVVSLSPDVLLTNVKRSGREISDPRVFLQYKSNFAVKQVPVTIHLKQGETVIYTKDTVTDLEAGKVVGFSLPVKNSYRPQSDPFISAEVIVTINNKPHVYTHYLRVIKYDHIPAIHYFYKDNVHVLNEENKSGGQKNRLYHWSGRQSPGGTGTNGL
jgi:hypothetical protein